MQLLKAGGLVVPTLQSQRYITPRVQGLGKDLVPVTCLTAVRPSACGQVLVNAIVTISQFRTVPP